MAAKKKFKLPRMLDPRVFFKQSQVPFIVYGVVLAALAGALALQVFHPDLALNLFSELLGAAFTLFIIDVLLVRSNARRWQIVHKHIDYLIARDINRIRDGIATRAFLFSPEIDAGKPEYERLASLRDQRASFLSELETLSYDDIRAKLSETELFSSDNYAYFNGKADDIWNLLNMKYAEYLDPQLVGSLIELHTNLKDICSHIRQFQKAEDFPEDRKHYHALSLKGCSISLKKILRIVNRLKEEGYSTTAALSAPENSTRINSEKH